MRVLTVGNMYPPHHFGGYEQVWRAAVQHLRGQGHEVRVLATGFRHPDVSDGNEPDVYRALRWYWSEHEFANMGAPERVRIERHNHAQLARHVGELDPAVVSFWSMGGMSHSLIEDVRLRGLPMAAFVHDTWLNYGPYMDQWLRIFRGWRRRTAPLVRTLTRLPTHVDYGAAGRYIFVSDYVRRRALASHRLPDTAVAHSGIAPSFLDAGTEHEWRWRLLFVGRLHPDKGTEDAVGALKQMPPEATLTLAGSWDAREEDSLRSVTRELGLEDRVRMLGHLPQVELPKLYHDHDALLFPVRWEEPWGLVPLEAMGSGCPVIATGRGGSGEYLRDGENCLLVPTEDPGAIASALRHLAAEPQLRRRLRAGGIETAPRHTEPVFNAEVERHLTEVSMQSIPRIEPVPP